MDTLIAQVVGIGLSIMVVLGLLGPCTAENGADGLTEAESSEGGWIPLFNGTDINEDWIVQGLESCGPQVREKNKDLGLQFRSFDWWALITQRKFRNFALRFDVRFQKKTSNSGVLLRTPQEKIYEDRRRCFEIQLVGSDDGKPAVERSGAVFGALAPRSSPMRKLGEWNSVEIVLSEPKLRVTLNGEVVQDVDLAQVEAAPTLRPVGSIAFQYVPETGRTYYRNIEVKPLN